MTDVFAPGLYFGLPEDEYHADPAFSSSGVKDMLVSPLTYWMRSPLNPDREDDQTDAKDTGKAFHARLLEGEEAFLARYAVAPDPDAYPDAIMDGAGLRQRCAELGLKKSGSNAELCERILDADPSAILWPVVKAEFEKGAEGKTIISPKTEYDIYNRARIVELHDSAKKAFAGGYPEVSFFWVDPETGIRMKSRADYLKARAIVDIKTFSNPFNMPIDQAVARAVGNYRYHLQAVIYSDGMEHVKELYRKKGQQIIHGTIPKGWLDAWAEPAPHAFVFVFIETGLVPNVRVREFRQTEHRAQQGATANLYWQSGWAGYRQAIEQYQACMKRYGPETPWFEQEPMRPFVDEEMPQWLFG